MDQEAWNQIYADLERDVAALRQRGATVSDIDIILGIDRARFAMERGEADEAIARIQALKQQLNNASAAAATRSGPTGDIPAVGRLDALEDNLHATTRLGSARLEIVGEDEEPPSRAASQNTKVNKSIKYDDIKDEFTRLWAACKIRDDKVSAVRREADRVIANRSVYEEISGETEVPWWFVGLIHGMECSFSLGKHLHNGDSLKARTWQVPAGRPKEGSPPFSFVASAIDALEYDGFAGKDDWPLPMVLYRLERYNGFGYRRKFGFASPYLWSYTSHFSSGKYVKDGVFDPNAVSKQCGAAAMLRDLMERGVVSFGTQTPVATAPAVVAAAPQPAPAPTPVPAPVQVPSPAETPAPGPAATPAPAPRPVVVTTPEAQPTPMPAAAPTPAPTPVAAPAPTPTPSPAAPKPVVVAVAPAPAPTPPAPAAAPAPVSPAAPAAIPAATTPAAAQSPAAASSAPSVPAASSSGVSSAVADALAELSKRTK